MLYLHLRYSCFFSLTFQSTEFIPHSAKCGVRAYLRVWYNRADVWGSKLFHYSHPCCSPRHTYSQSVIGLVEGDELSANAASGRYSVTKSMAKQWLQEYRTDGQAGRRPRTGYGTYTGQIGMLHQLPESKGTPSSMQGSLRLLQICLGRNVMLLGDIGVTGLIIMGGRSRPWVLEL